jgi:hypothetical protein
MQLASYRSVFDLERRIYRIDTVRLNPGGVPLRGVVYGAALICCSVVAGALAPLSWLLAPLPWYLRCIGIPVALAALLTVVRVEGRPFHLAAQAILAHRLGGRRLTALRRSTRIGARWQPAPVVFLPDGSDARMRPLRYRGPGAVLVCCEHSRVEWARTRFARRVDVTVEGAAWPRPLAHGRAIELAPGAVLQVRPGSLS